MVSLATQTSAVHLEMLSPLNRVQSPGCPSLHRRPSLVRCNASASRHSLVAASRPHLSSPGSLGRSLFVFPLTNPIQGMRPSFSSPSSRRTKPKSSNTLTPPSALRSEGAAADEEDDFEEEYDEEEDADVADELDDDASVSVATLDAASPHVSVEPTEQKQTEAAEEKKAEENLSTLYSITMQAAMANNSLVYTHEDGINYARVLPDLMVGSCPQNAEDVDTLRDKESVGSILCLQQNSDLEWFGMDINEIVGRTTERGDIRHVRAEIRDFDPFSLRLQLPEAVAKLHKANLERGTVYIHCTAGLGRAPAVALAYMWWMRDFPKLEDANTVLQAVRRCGPKLFAIRAALCDILTGSPKEPITVRWRNRGVMPKKVEVAGLDIGWHNRQELDRVPNSPYWALTRELPVGKYYYKFIVDGDKWSYNIDAPLTLPDRDQNVNNYAEVPGWSLTPEAQAIRKHFMEEDMVLDGVNRALVVERINKLAESL